MLSENQRYIGPRFKLLSKRRHELLILVYMSLGEAEDRTCDMSIINLVRYR